MLDKKQQIASKGYSTEVIVKENTFFLLGTDSTKQQSPNISHKTACIKCNRICGGSSINLYLWNRHNYLRFSTRKRRTNEVNYKLTFSLPKNTVVKFSVWHYLFQGSMDSHALVLCRETNMVYRRVSLD